MLRHLEQGHSSVYFPAFVCTLRFVCNIVRRTTKFNTVPVQSPPRSHKTQFGDGRMEMRCKCYGRTSGCEMLLPCLSLVERWNDSFTGEYVSHFLPADSYLFLSQLLLDWIFYWYRALLNRMAVKCSCYWCSILCQFRLSHFPQCGGIRLNLISFWSLCDWLITAWMSSILVLDGGCEAIACIDDCDS